MKMNQLFTAYYADRTAVYEKSLDYEGTNRNTFPFFHEAETSVSSFCLICFFILKSEDRSL